MNEVIGATRACWEDTQQTIENALCEMYGPGWQVYDDGFVYFEGELVGEVMWKDNGARWEVELSS